MCVGDVVWCGVSGGAFDAGLLRSQVTNTGKVASDHVVLGMLKPPGAGILARLLAHMG